MNEETLVQKFNNDLDSILEGRTPGKDEVSLEYSELINVASVLKQVNFDSTGQSKSRIRQQVLSRNQRYNQSNKEVFMNSIFRMRRPALALGSAVTVAVIALSLAFPGTMTAMASSAAHNIGKILKIGNHSSVIQLDDEDTVFPALNGEVEITMKSPNSETMVGEVTISEHGSGSVAGIAVISPDGETRVAAKATTDEYSGETKPPLSEIIKYDSLSEAQKATSFNVLVPDYLPAGYSFKEAQGYGSASDCIDLNYKGDGQDIILMQKLMNEQTYVTYATNGSVEQVDINGAVGVWIESYSLVWERDGVNYSLYCKDLNKDEAIKIARSIK